MRKRSRRARASQFGRRQRRLVRRFDETTEEEEFDVSAGCGDAVKETKGE